MTFVHIRSVDCIDVAMPAYHMKTPIYGVFWDGSQWYSNQNASDLLCFPESFVIK